MFDFAKKIRKYRKRKCLKQEELAKILSVSSVSVYRLKTGGFKSTMDTRDNLSLSLLR